MPDTAAGHRPFYDSAWPRPKRDAARAIWDWHLALCDPHYPALDGNDLAAYFAAEREKAEAGEPLDIVPEDVRQRAYDACAEHDLPRELLVRQIDGAHRRVPPVRFESAKALRGFADRWVVPHARLLAHLGGATGSWQRKPVRELARGFFSTGRLAQLSADLDANRLFIPQERLKQQGVSLQQLRDGHLDESVRRLLWKQTVRARDYLAQGRSLADDLRGRLGRHFKRWWLGALEVLSEIERREFDVWSEPVRLSRWHRLQVRFQALLGKMTFRQQR
jgi:phytoene synthase